MIYANCKGIQSSILFLLSDNIELNLNKENWHHFYLTSIAVVTSLSCYLLTLRSNLGKRF